MGYWLTKAWVWLLVALVALVGAVLYALGLRRQVDAAKSALRVAGAANELEHAIASEKDLHAAFEAAKARDAAAAATAEQLAAMALENDEKTQKEGDADVADDLGRDGFR